MIEDALPAALCDRAIAKAAEVGFEPSAVYDDRRIASALEPGYRNSESAWLEPGHDRELYRLIQGLFESINSKRFRFSIYGMEPLQVIKYLPGAFFAEHFDIGVGDPAKRKISLLVQLSEPGDYEGGDVVLGSYMTMPKVRGTGCAFPSWLAHRVETVESGVRYSLAAWAKGNYFF